MRPRDLVIAHLRSVGEVTDPAGRASAALAEAVGYTGTSLAFAQLLYGMEQSGLIEREVRGKRTYRIASASTAASERARDGEVTGIDDVAGIDYDELARRLLVQVVRRVAAPSEPGPSGSGPFRPGQGDADLAWTVASLERKLASVEERQRRLRTENERLRELLDVARQDLADQQALAAGDAGAGQLLERLLTSSRGDESPGRSA